MNILCFGDSNTYGYCPDGSGRFDADTVGPVCFRKSLEPMTVLLKKVSVEELPSFPMNCGKAAVDWIRSVFSWKAMPLWICSS